MPGSIQKVEIRNRIWSLLTQAGIALFPGAYGRTPDFRGKRQVSEQLAKVTEWRDARRVLVLSEPVLRRARQAVVEEGKVLIVPDLARTGSWIVEIDPAAAPKGSASDLAAHLDAARTDLPAGVRTLHGRDVAPVDLMVVGAVGVDRGGTRVGKGLGEADLVYALGRARGFILPETPVVVLVHDLQLQEEFYSVREPTDLPVDIIVTPRGAHAVRSLHLRPSGLDRTMITPGRLKAFPGLVPILEREGLYPPPDAHPSI